VREANSFQHPDEVPTDVGLIPVQAEPRRASVRVMVLVPVLSPGSQLKGAEPPDIDAGIAFLGFAEMREAVYQTLQVQRIDEPQSTHPEKAHPAKTKNQANENRKKNERRFGPAPYSIDAAG
jgi:hypothetical protein